MSEPISSLSNLKVGDLLSDIIKVESEESAAKVRRIFRDFKPRTIAVVQNNRLLGIIYRSSIVALTSRKTNALAKDIMEDPPFVAYPRDSLIQTIEKMINYDEWNVTVINEKYILLGGLLLESFIRRSLDLYRDHLDKLKVKDFMSIDVITVSPEDFIMNVISKMIERRYSGFPVTDEKGRLVGIITQYDIISKGFTRIELESESGPVKGAKVKKAMTYTVSYLYPWSTLLEATELMVKRGYGRIPVVEDPSEKRLVGIIDREDVSRALLHLIRKR